MRLYRFGQRNGDPSEVVSRISIRMFTTKPFGEGTGLGLSIVHDIVSGDFQGSIDVETRPGEGTTFIVRLSSPATRLSFDSAQARKNVHPVRQPVSVLVWKVAQRFVSW